MRAATSASAACGPNWGSGTPNRTNGRRGRTRAPSGQVVGPGGVLARDQRRVLGRYIAEMLGERVARLWPRAVAVRVVGRPHDVPQAGPMPLGDPGEVLDEGGMSLAVPIGARLLLDGRLGPETVLVEGLVHALDEVGNPADAALDEHEVERRVALEEDRKSVV